MLISLRLLSFDYGTSQSKQFEFHPAPSRHPGRAGSPTGYGYDQQELRDIAELKNSGRTTSAGYSLGFEYGSSNYPVASNNTWDSLSHPRQSGGDTDSIDRGFSSTQYQQHQQQDPSLGTSSYGASGRPRSRSPKEAFENGEYWRGQARPGSAIAKQWQSHKTQLNDPNRMNPAMYLQTVVNTAAGGGRGSTMSPRDAAKVNKSFSAGTQSNIIQSDYW